MADSENTTCIMDGECSLPTRPLMFLIYINDISEQVSSPSHLFTDDCLLYRVIHTETDAQQIQSDLDCLSRLAETWKMSFNITKCVVMKCSKSSFIIS